MSGVRAMLERVRRLEQARVAPKSPFEIAYGSLEGFEAEVRAAVDAGSLDASDMYGVAGSGGVMRAIRSWHEKGFFGAWRRDRQVWEYGQ